MELVDAHEFILCSLHAWHFRFLKQRIKLEWMSSTLEGNANSVASGCAVILYLWNSIITPTLCSLYHPFPLSVCVLHRAPLYFPMPCTAPSQPLHTHVSLHSRVHLYHNS